MYVHMCMNAYVCKMCVFGHRMYACMCAHVRMFLRRTQMFGDRRRTQCWQCSHRESNGCSQKDSVSRRTQDEPAIQLHHLAISTHDIGA